MKTVLIYSGGLDSTVLLYQLRKENHEVFALSVHYGQRHHQRELSAARQLCHLNDIEHRVADLSGIAPLLAGSSLTDLSIPIPEGHYEEDSMKSTVVPNRNMILLSLATAWAISLKADSVAYAAHGGDHTLYPDCRESFARAIDKAIRLTDWHPVYLHHPFVRLSKSDLVRLGATLGVPFDKTWSCYQGRDLHCGCCGTCLERREAFHLAGVPDPTAYAPNAPDPGTLIANHWKLPC